MITRVRPVWSLALVLGLCACEIPFAASPAGGDSAAIDDASIEDAVAADVTEDRGVDAPPAETAIDAGVDARDAPPDALDASVDATRDGPDASDAPDAPDANDAARDVVDVATPLDARDAPDAALADVLRDVSDAGDASDASDVTDASDGSDASDASDVVDVVDASDSGVIAAPRPVAPMPTAATNRRGVTLRWALPAAVDGALLTLCADPLCAVEDFSTTVTGTSYTFTSDLSPGAHWWRLRGRSGGATGASASPIWSFRVLALGAATNAPWGTWPDLNGDGYSDVLVGRLDTPVYMLGGASGITALTPLRSIATAPFSEREFGRVVANAGDTDGDGLTDVLVSGVSGRVWYLRARASADLSTVGFSTPVSLQPQVNGAVFSAAGDVNGDGYGDVVVTSASTEMLYVYYGSASGLGVTAALTYRGTTGGFGDSVAGAGDYNADGYADVLVGDPSSRTVVVFFGSSAGLVTSRTDPLQPFSRRYLSGTNVASVALAGDLDGDGVSDVLVGSTNSTYDVLLGRAGVASLSSPSAFAPSVTVSARVVSGAADLNGDGFSDFAVGDGNGNLRIATSSALGASIVVTDSRFSPTVFASAGDINRDGLGDIVMGDALRGRVAFYLGARGATPVTLVDGPSSTVTGYAGSVALAPSRRPRPTRAAK